MLHTQQIIFLITGTSGTFCGFQERNKKRNVTRSSALRLERERNEFQLEGNDNEKNEFFLKCNDSQQCPV